MCADGDAGKELQLQLERNFGCSIQLRSGWHAESPLFRVPHQIGTFFALLLRPLKLNAYGVGNSSSASAVGLEEIRPQFRAAARSLRNQLGRKQEVVLVRIQQIYLRKNDLERASAQGFHR